MEQPTGNSEEQKQMQVGQATDETGPSQPPLDPMPEVQPQETQALVDELPLSTEPQIAVHGASHHDEIQGATLVETPTTPEGLTAPPPHLPSGPIRQQHRVAQPEIDIQSASYHVKPEGPAVQQVSALLVAPPSHLPSGPIEQQDVPQEQHVEDHGELSAEKTSTESEASVTEPQKAVVSDYVKSSKTDQPPPYTESLKRDSEKEKTVGFKTPPRQSSASVLIRQLYGEPEPPFDNYMLISIFAMCCIPPLGLVAVFFSQRASQYMKYGDRFAADEAANTAKTVSTICLILAVLGLLVAVSLQSY